MSLVSTRLSLTHRCIIERDMASASDWGTPDTPDWQSHLADVPCRVWTPSGRQIVEDSTAIVSLEDPRLIVGAGTDVVTGDRILSVTYRGDTVQPGPLQVEAVLFRADHLELALVRAD